MKHIKKTKDNLPDKYEIDITAQYYYDTWNGEYRVNVEATLRDNYNTLKQYSYNVAKPKPFKVFWITVKQPKPWKQAVLDVAAELEQDLRDWLYVKQQDKVVNDGLLDSLDKL